MSRLGGVFASLMCVVVSGCSDAPDADRHPMASFYEVDDSIETAFGSDASYAGVELVPEGRRVLVWRVAPSPAIDEAAAGLEEDAGGHLTLLDAAFGRQHLCATREELEADEDLTDKLGLIDPNVGFANDGSGLLVATTTTAADLPNDVVDELQRRLGVPVSVHPGSDPLMPVVLAEPGQQAGGGCGGAPP